MLIESSQPVIVRRLAGDLRLVPGFPVDLPDDDAIRLLAKTNKVHPVLHPGEWVEWRSPALPQQRGEVLAVYTDRTFEVFHPLTEAVCRLPIAWVTQVLRDPAFKTDSSNR
ncbi:MAG: hypothetical protein Nkreftii_004175 [Candidatus Nitrospira kreftii]|uniref:Uncharacterized protein n=1 Tax=Candidatus Nitrospira kreftii TaxID=2652173 RepID=A0A7S8FIF9_9BACT|nr:MAG: hypothetical protein Nkreftii_004175 [Candidatus Nitrospira kreftii]